MITISDIVQNVITRITACIPAQLKSSVLRFPDKPEQFTTDVLRKNHPGGAIMVKYLKSVNEGGAEVVIVGVCVVAETSLREEKLAEAVRGYMNKHRMAGVTQFEFSGDENIEVDMGIVCRTVAYRCNRPAVPANDIAAFNAALNL